MKKVFEKLASRWYSENSLSDVTWAFAESHPAFKRSFLSFFFPDFEKVEDKDLPELIRESATEGARVDFFFRYKDQPHLIEVKIWDQNHHFKQYDMAYSGSKKGYITNYNHHEIEGYEIRNWMSFKDHLQYKISPASSPDFQLVIGFYLSFLTNVCKLHEIPKMNLTQVSSLHPLRELLGKICQQSHPAFRISINNSAKSFDQNRYGIYLNVKPQNSEMVFWCWIGMWLWHENPYIYMDLNISQLHLGDEFYQTLNEGSFHKRPYTDREVYPALCFELRDEIYDTYNQAETTNLEQEQIMGSFFKEVLNVIKFINETIVNDNASH